MATFKNAFDEKVHPLIDRIDKVRSILPDNMKGITFPNVVVVGDQSSGKSTLLESLSLVELPKGTGIVTRCPLVLRLRNSNERRVYHLRADNKKVLLNESQLNIMNYIEKETNKLAGNQKNVVNKLIELQVEDPNVRDLTVVDLPGIVRNPIADQPKNIQKQITDLIRNYISQDGCIILCVFAANSDIATAESFALASEVDPEGVRTIGVITKSDLAVENKDKDKLLQQLLMERVDVLKLKLGFIAVRCRSTDEKISLKDAHEREKEFFKEFSATVGKCIGIGALINRLADLYSDRIKDMFPKIQADIRKKWITTCDELSKFPRNLDTSDSRVAKYHQLIYIYVEMILKVRFLSSNESMQDSLINSLHKEFILFENVVENHKKELLTRDFCDKVRARMDTSFGKQLPNFLPHSVLQYCISEKIDRLWEAVRILIEKCFLKALEFLPKDTDEDCNDVFLKKLLPLFNEIAKSFIHEQKKEVRHKLLELMNLEKNDPYTMNHYYMDTISKFKNKHRQLLDADDGAMYDSMSAISNDNQAVREMLISIFVYWKVVTKRFMDYIAKYLREKLVFNICPGVREALNRVSIEQSHLVHKFLTTDECTLQQITKCQQNKETLEKMYTILSGENLEGHQGQIQYADSDMNDSDIEYATT